MHQHAIEGVEAAAIVSDAAMHGVTTHYWATGPLRTGTPSHTTSRPMIVIVIARSLMVSHGMQIGPEDRTARSPNVPRHRVPCLV